MGAIPGGGLHCTTSAQVVAWSVWVISVVVGVEAVSSTTTARVVITCFTNGVHFIGWFRGLLYLYTVWYFKEACLVFSVALQGFSGFCNC